jgi:hypothetical protein
MSKKLFVTAALALTGAMVAGAAQAYGGDDVQWSVTIGTPIGTPVYTQPAPVYVQPAPVYVRPAPVYQRGYREPTRWDRDGDGIPNRYDALYNPRWDRDGDGVPDRYETRYNRRHDRDGEHWDGRSGWHGR